jgi:hypothetical protein
MDYICITTNNPSFAPGKNSNLGGGKLISLPEGFFYKIRNKKLG